MLELEQIVAQNITALRKQHMWTQAELAEKINYSDKSVSKWERGEALPDLKVLKKLADLWGVTVDFFLYENAADSPAQYMAPQRKKRFQLWVTALAVCLVWLIATAVYVYVSINGDKYVWQAFIWALPASFLVLEFFDRRFFGKRATTFNVSAFLWTLITSIFLQWLPLNLWMLYLIGVPAQVAIILTRQIQRSK